MIRKLWNTLRGKRMHDDIDNELQFHLDQRVEELVATGKTPEEARRQVQLRFGNKLLVEERTASAYILGWLEDVLRDFRYGLRSLGRTPALSCVAVLSLALAIGANLGIFRVFDALLLRTLPVREPHTLLQLIRADPRMQGRAGEFWSYPFFRGMREQSREAVDLFASSGSLRTWVRWGDKEVTEELAERQYVSGDFFTFLGVDTVIGRPFAATDGITFGTHPVAVLSYGYWQRRFGGAASVLGQKFQLGGNQFQIIGVTRPGFSGIEVGKAPDIWLPTAMQNTHSETAWSWGWLKLYGRLRPGVSMDQASATLRAIYPRLGEEEARAVPEQSRAQGAQPKLEVVAADKGSSFLRTEYVLPIRVAMAVVGLVLLIACVNVVNLLLARGNARRAELAIRMGIGAGRGRLVRQLLIESLTLAAAGSVLGLALAFWATPMLLRLLQTESDSVAVDVSLDWRQFGAAAVLCAITTLLFGLLPALRASRIKIDAVLKGSRSTGASFGGVLLGRTMVGVQVALSLALLLIATLFLATLRNLAAVRAGFDRDQILIAQLNHPALSTQQQRRALWNEVQRRVSSIPGVEGTAFSNWPLFTRNTWGDPIHIQGRPGRSQGSPFFLVVSPGYFATMGTRLRSGRAFEARDVDSGSPPVAVVNESAVRKILDGDPPLGLRFALNERNPAWIEIVGVVEDIKYNDLRRDVSPMIYFPMREFDGGLSLQIRTRAEVGALGATIRREIASVGPIRIERITSQSTLINDTLVRERLIASVSGLFAFLALVLSAIGLFGVMTYSVTQRTREIGLRMAVGARQSNVLRMILKESLVSVVAGIVAGLALAVPAARLVAGLLFGLKPTDPSAVAVAVFVLVGVAGFASYLPARRASRIDPLAALRCE